MIIRRGDIYYADLRPVVGSEQGGVRPVLIIQNDVGNQRSGNTIVIPITHDRSTLPCVASIITQYETDGVTIKLDGQANASNMMCVSKARLGNYVATLSAGEMKAIDEAIAKTVGLMGYYSKSEKQLNDKLTYIKKIKEERNQAQDTRKAVCDIMGVRENISTEELLQILQKRIDTVK